MNINGINYYLPDDIDTLICKLENKLNRMYLDKIPWSTFIVDGIEEDLMELKTALDQNDKVIMRKMLGKYSAMFQRYQ